MATRLDIAVLGDGGWGTTLAILLAKKKFAVTLWGAFPEYVAALDKRRVNTKFLPGVRIPASVHITASVQEALQGKTLVILAVPSQYLRGVLSKIKAAGYDRKAVYLSVIKGIEVGSLKRVSQVIEEELGKVNLAVLSGPTIAHELASGLPTTAVVAARDGATLKFLQHVLATKNFRIYTNNDIIGVELGGSLKNVIAIACGIADGLGYGTNTKAALLTRGLAEISRLGKKMGADPRTFSGLSGLGDLVTTCISPLSRNRHVGEQIGKGKSLRQVTGHMQMVAEGVLTAKSAYQLGSRYGIDLPITSEVYKVLYKNKSPLKAVGDLMTRQKKREH